MGRQNSAIAVIVLLAILLTPITNIASVNAQTVSNLGSTTGTLSGLTSTLNNLTSGTGGVTSTLNNLTSGTLNNVTSILDNLTGTLIFPNGTLFTLVNGVPMKFLLDTKKPSINDPTITVNALDQSGNVRHMYVELQNTNGTDIASGYTPVSFATTSGHQYILYANNYQNIIFAHWDDGTTNPARTITPTQAETFTAYYNTGTSSGGSGGTGGTGGSSGTGGTPGSIVLNSVQSTSGIVSSSPYQMTLTNVNGGTGNDNILVVGVSADNHSVASVTYGGVSLTKAISSFTNNYASFWYLVNPSGTGNVIVTLNGPSSAVVGSYVLSGVDQTNPIPSNTANSNSSPSSPSISLTTTNPNDLVLDLTSIYGGSTLGSPTCTQGWDLNVPSAITGASSSTVVSSPSTVTCGWTASGGGDLWDDVAIEVKAASTTSGGSGSTATIPGAPTGLAATQGNAQIALSWIAPSNNGGSAIVSYNIYRSTISGAEGTTPIITGVTSTSYTDTGLTNGQAYYYKVTAVNSVGESPQSNEATATPSSPVTVPQPPSGLTATAVSSSQIDLSWTAPSNNGGSTITGYKIERSTNSGMTWSTIQSNTGTAGTTYSDTGLAASTAYAYRVSAINSAGTSTSSGAASATTKPNLQSVVLARTGLEATDSLTNETETQQQLESSTGYWTYNGDASGENAPYQFNRDTQGLHIGIEAPSNGTWAGFYAVSPGVNATLWHAVITDPVRTVPNNYYDNGLYVQTSSKQINYVTCVALTNTQTTVWAVISSIGNSTQANQFKVLWMDNTANQPLKHDCTIITNGNNYLKVYMDNNLVYSNSTLNLQMPAPFNAYLEPETSSASQMLVGTYQDYYITSGENIQLTNLPNGAATVDLVDSSGNLLASGQVSSGNAILNVGKYHLPLAGTIKVYDSSNTLLATGSANIYGGDVYSTQ